MVQLDGCGPSHFTQLFVPGDRAVPHFVQKAEPGSAATVTRNSAPGSSPAGTATSSVRPQVRPPISPLMWSESLWDAVVSLLLTVVQPVRGG